MKSIDFELQTAIKYSNGSGAEIESNQITLQEPTGKVSHICCEIESLIQSGMLKMADLMDEATIEEAKEKAIEAKNNPFAEEDGDEERKGPDAQSILSIMSGGGVDMKKVTLNFRELFKEVALAGGEKKMTVPIMDRMSHKDFRRMMGEYASNFIMD